MCVCGYLCREGEVVCLRRFAKRAPHQISNLGSLEVWKFGSLVDW